MHLARLWDSSRRSDGGYSLEELTHDPKVMDELHEGHIGELVVGKISMNSLFGKKKMKRDGSVEKLVTLDPVETLQRRERIPWICYSALDSISTLKLFYSLREKLLEKEWVVGSKPGLTMYYFYEKYWRPFGVLLAKIESEGMLVDREYLSSMKEVAIADRQIAADVFRKWASKYCPDAKYMNVSSDIQIRQLFFGGTLNRKDKNKSLPVSKAFKVHDTESGIVDKKTSKYRDITLHRLNMEMQTEMYTPSGWPSVTLDTLKEFAGKVPLDHIYFMGYEDGNESYGSEEISTDKSLIGENETANSDVNLSSMYGTAYQAFGGGNKGREAYHAIAALCEFRSIDSLLSNFILPLLNQPPLEKDRYKIRKAFIAEPGNSLIVADYGQLELRILAHLANCRSMLEAFKAGGDFHSRTAMNMHENILDDVREGNVLLEWEPKPGEEKPPVPLLKEIYAAERREAKMLNFSIAYGKTAVGLSQDWKVSVEAAKNKIELWYKDRKEVLKWQEECKRDVKNKGCVYTVLGRARHFPSFTNDSLAQRHHMERSAINTPVQGSAADIAMCAMLEIDRNPHLKELRWRLIMQVHDELILEGPTESAEEAKKIIVTCMSKPFNGQNLLRVDLTVDAKCGKSWYEAK